MTDKYVSVKFSADEAKQIQSYKSIAMHCIEYMPHICVGDWCEVAQLLAWICDKIEAAQETASKPPCQGCTWEQSHRVSCCTHPENTTGKMIAENCPIMKPASATIDPAPENSLPTWKECSIRVANEKYLIKRGLELDPSHSKLPNELHRFIYEYDDSDPYKSAWFLHRLEKLIRFVKSEPASAEPVVFDLPEYNAAAMGCGLEDKGMTDRYDAMAYGWVEAMDRVEEMLEHAYPLYAHPPAQQWIKCSERMPAVGQPVLVYGIDEYPVVAYITAVGWVCYATDNYIAGEPAHWMPLPQPPEVE